MLLKHYLETGWRNLVKYKVIGIVNAILGSE